MAETTQNDIYINHQPEIIEDKKSTMMVVDGDDDSKRDSNDSKITETARKEELLQLNNE